MLLHSVQIGVARKVAVGGRTVLTAIGKTPVAGPVAVGPLGLAGDEQADLSVHGGLEKAVYAYPLEHYAFWNDLRQRAGLADIEPELPTGAMGENLTLQGLLEHQLWVGDVLVFDNCRLRVTQPREPCYKFNIAWKTPPKRTSGQGTRLGPASYLKSPLGPGSWSR